MTKPRPTSPVIRLDLDNFDLAQAERSRYVLNSPRSLESCARLGVKPVELLIKSLNELVAEQKDAPYEAVRVMHESYEKERMKLLQMCREERERIIQAAGDRWPGSSSSKVSVRESKLKDHSVQRQSIPYADLCLTGKSVSRSSCSASSGGPRDPDRSTVCSYSVGELRHSPANETILQRLIENIEKEMCVTVSERDRKIAALMLVKHQEERARLKLSQQEEDKREEARKQEEAQRSETEKRRRKKLRHSMRRWQEELEARRRLREHQEKEKAGQLEQEVMLQEDRWMRLKEEVEVQRRAKMESALKKAEERKRYQEKLLREKQELEEREREKGVEVAAKKEKRARRSKVVLEMKERRRLQEENDRELLRHVLLKRQVEQQVEQEKEQMRSTLERKLQHSYKKHAQVVEARMRELHERGAREEEQIQRAQLRAKMQSVQQLTHKQILAQLSQRRMEKAALHASAQYRNRAQQTHQRNARRRLCHQRLRERMQREEEAARKVRESYVFMKDWKRERLRRQREQIQEEAQSLARASFHMRERVRRQIHSRTFDRMALDAQLAASISRMKL